MENSIIWEKSSTMDAHSFVARNFAHLYAVGGRQHSMDAVAEMQGMPDYFLGETLWRQKLLKSTQKKST